MEMNSATERIKYILHTLLIEYTDQAPTHTSRIFHHVFNAREHICKMTIRGSMYKAEHDIKIIMSMA